MMPRRRRTRISPCTSRKPLVEQFEQRRLLAGDFDLSFGINGRVVTPFYNQEFSSESASAAAKQSNGNLIVAGGTEVLIRVTPSGALDTSFGESGRVLMRGGVNDLAVDSQDRVIAVGQVQEEYRSVNRLVRLLPNGSLDSSFGTNGIVLSRTGPVSDQLVSVDIQPDGKIVVGIRTNSGSDLSFGSNLDFGLERYNTDGTLDTSFGTNGRVVTSLGGTADLIGDVTLQPDGKILVAGRSGSSSIQHSMNTALVRYLPSGALDTSFDGDGIQVINLSRFNFDDGASTLALQPDGKIVIGGSANNGINTDFLLARFNADGSPDASFNPGGPRVGAKEFTFGAASDFVLDIEVRQNGQLWVLGSGTNTISSNRFSLLMLVNSNGSFDTNYDVDGWLQFSYPGYVEATSSRILAGPGESLIGVGITQTQVPLTPNTFATNSDFAFVGFTPQGQIDLGFGTNGFARIDTQLGTSSAARAAVQSDGKLLVLGTTTAKNSTSLTGEFEYQWAMARYNVDGSLDNSFGVNGRAVAKFANGLATQASDLVIQPDGKIVVLGRVADTFTVGRFLSNGAPDLQFGTQGFQSRNFGTGLDIPFAIDLKTDGKIVFVGYKQDFNSNFSGFLPASAVVGQLNSDGTWDSSFGTAGSLEFKVGVLGSYGSSVGIQQDGSIVVGGYTQTTNSTSFAARLLGNGTFDPSFGVAGISIFGVTNSVQFVDDLKIQPDGKIVLGGKSATGPKFYTTVSRLMPNGQIDTGFGVGGISRFLIGHNDSFGGLAIQPNGRIVVTTSSDVFANPADSIEYYEIGVARLLADGQFDPTFDGDGVLTLPFGPGAEMGRDVVLQNDGKIVLLGETRYPTSGFVSQAGDIIVARLNNSNLTVANSTVTANEGSIATNSGSAADVIGLTASVGTVTLNSNGTWTWQFLTNDGPTQSQTVTITAFDSSGLTNQITFDLVVRNVEPEVTVAFPTVTVSEGQVAQTSGTWFDPGQDSVVLTASIGNITLNSDGTWNWQWPTTDGPDESRTVSITATDKDGGSSTIGFSLVVINVAPTIAISGATTVTVGSTYVLSLSASADPGNDTISSWTINWGDGLIETIVGNPSNVSHVFAVGGVTRTISAVASDEDGNYTSNTIVVAVVSPVLEGPSATILPGGILQILGTRYDDTIRVVPQGQDSVKVLINGKSYGVFPQSSFTLIHISGNRGDDDIEVSGNINKTALILGESGDDRLKGGSGTNVLVGGKGDDVIIGGNKNDILIGGVGEDRLVGNAGDDILIGGYTEFDTNFSALGSLLSEWSREVAYSTRVQNLMLGGGLNGSYALNAATVRNDDDEDTLTGSAGRDWYFASLYCFGDDEITDRKNDERIN